MTDMTPCEERGLKEGQWVWAHDANYGEAAWVEFRRIRAEGVFICFYPPLRKELNFLKDEIDFTKGIHDEKPSWTPKEYGGEGSRDVKESLTTDDPRDPRFWENAPEGATHWDEKYKVWRRGGANFWKNGKWANCIYDVYEQPDCIPRPTTPEWPGEGLPPVGTVCDVMYPGRISSDRVQIAGHYKGRVIVAWGQEDDLSCFFAPYGTSFQPVESERERVIEGACRALDCEAHPPTIRDMMRLYDAGWLKEPERV